MSNYSTTADLLDDVLWRSGELITAGDRTSDMATVALIYLNRAYQQMCVGGGELVPDMYEDWWWLYKKPPATLILNPEYTTGTVSVTNNSASGSFSSPPSTSKAGWFLKIQGTALGNADVPRILTHTAGAAAFTLDAVYTGSTSTAASFDCFQLEYTLATDVLRLVAPMRQYRTSDPDYFVYQVDPVSGDASFPLALVEAGTPTRFEIVNIDSAGLVTVRFNRWGGTAATDFIRLEYDYLFQPAALTDSASSMPLVPLHYRHVLADTAVYYMMVDKDETRAQMAIGMAKGGLLAMQKENQKRLGSAGRFRLGHLTPRPSDWLRSQPLRTQTGLIIG